MVNRIKKLGGTGIISIDNLPSIECQRGRVLNLLLDKRWHTSLEILEAAGGTEGLRRLRQIRDIPRLGVIKRRTKDSRIFEYKLTISSH